MIHVDPQSSVPVFEQVVRSVCRALADGLLKPGDRLPAIRDVALACRINRNTVARAYRELEQDGLVVTRPGAGTVVRETVPEAMHQVRLARLREDMAPAIIRARAYGLTGHVIHELVDDMLTDGGE